MTGKSNLTVASNETDSSLRKSRRLISPLTGIIRSVEEVALGAEDAAEVSLFVSSLADVSRFSRPLSNLVHGAIALTKKEARVKAIGEAIERYCSAFYDRESLIVGSYEEIGEPAIHPSRFALYSQRQHAKARFPYPRFDERLKVSWVRGYSLTRSREVLVPASLVYLPYNPASRGEALLSPAISTGLACRGSFEQAALIALCEAIERDACMIMWFNRLSMPRVAFDGERLSALFEEKFSHPSLCVHLIDVTTDVKVPAFMALTFGRMGNRPIVTAGACSHLDPLQAALKAVSESINSGTILQLKMKQSPDWHYEPDFSNIVDFIDHAFLYYQPEMFEHLEFAHSSETVKNLSEIPNLSTGDRKGDLQTCARMLEARGLEAIIVDLTTEDIADAGFSVVRALIPGMIGLNADYNLRFLGGERLYSAPVAMGYLDRNSTEEEINPYPHPFQ